MDHKKPPSLRNLDQVSQQLKKVREQDVSEEFLREYNYFRSLLEITHSISTSRDFKQLLELIVDSAMTLAKAERGFLILVRNDGNLEFRVQRNISKTTIESDAFKISRTVVNQVLTEGKPLFVSAIHKDKNFKISKSIETLGLRMVMCVPLKARDRLLGLIYVDAKTITESFGAIEEKLFEAFASQASVAIDNSHLYDSSVHDSLTGLFNYGYLRVRLEEEISRISRYGKGDISFVMLDLDDFKAINTSFGHLFGNNVLVKVAELIKDSIRKCDIAARYGGDEFAIIMPESDALGAQNLAQRLRKEIAGLKFHTSDEVISVSTSMGISAFPSEKIVDGEHIIIEADHALMVAKSKGKNQIAVFGLRKDERKHRLELVGKSPAIDELKKMISKLAKTDATILITGETGTGKELVTKLVHEQSARVNQPLVVVNCGAIPDNLLESELFGHEKGAFTGAFAQHKGKFEIADGGTIFLDEIAELPLNLQVKILRAIEQKEIDRVGGKSPIKVNVRVIAATNRNLDDEIKHNRFRKDLYYRLSVATIEISPLRKRPEDIESLSAYYLGQMNKLYGRAFKGFTQGALNAMMHHPWPGNVREMIHRIERAVIMGSGNYLDEMNLGLQATEFTDTRKLKDIRGVAEKEAISQALTRNRWKMQRTARELGISRQTLRELTQKHNITRPEM